VYPVLNARVVDEESPSLPPAGPFVEATPVQEWNMKALLKSRKCRILSTLTFVLVVVGVIIAVLLGHRMVRRQRHPVVKRRLLMVEL
jgi:hypothetical protein